MLQEWAQSMETESTEEGKRESWCHVAQWVHVHQELEKVQFRWSGSKAFCWRSISFTQHLVHWPITKKHNASDTECASIMIRRMCTCLLTTVPKRSQCRKMKKTTTRSHTVIESYTHCWTAASSWFTIRENFSRHHVDFSRYQLVNSAILNFVVIPAIIVDSPN